MFLKRLEELKKLNFPSGSYLIWGSGLLAIRNLREAEDIDIIVRKELWEDLAQQYFIEGSIPNWNERAKEELEKDSKWLFSEEARVNNPMNNFAIGIIPLPGMISNNGTINVKEFLKLGRVPDKAGYTRAGSVPPPIL